MTRGLRRDVSESFAKLDHFKAEEILIFINETIHFEKVIILLHNFFTSLTLR
jgi:hypothetical protein